MPLRASESLVGHGVLRALQVRVSVLRASLVGVLLASLVGVLQSSLVCVLPRRAGLR